MKKIFRFLGVSVFLLALTGQSFAQKVYVDGQVRYGFELKQLTAQEAQQALSQGYVDLWTYMCYDEAFVNSGQIQLNADGTIRQFRILASENTHSYKIVDKNGNDDKTGSVAMFARPKTHNCTGNTRPNIFDNDIQNDPSNDGVFQSLSHTVIQNCCPTWAYGSSSRGGGYYTRQSDVNDYCTVIEAEGKKWYCLKAYLIRFEYKQAKSFYVTFYRGSAADGTTSNGASTYNAYADAGASQPLVWPGQTGDEQSWEFSGRYGFIQGGVEIIADPEFSLTAGATCGGSDLQGSFKVNNWNGKDWSDYKAVKMYVNTDGGTRKALAIGTDLVFSGTALCNASGAITATGTTADFSYSLTPSAYMMNGIPADSLIWAFEDTKITLI